MLRYSISQLSGYFAKLKYFEARVILNLLVVAILGGGRVTGIVQGKINGGCGISGRFLPNGNSGWHGAASYLMSSIIKIPDWPFGPICIWTEIADTLASIRILEMAFVWQESSGKLFRALQASSTIQCSWIWLQWYLLNRSLDQHCLKTDTSITCSLPIKVQLGNQQTYGPVIEN